MKSIRSKILAGCLVLTALTALLGLYAQQAERQLGELALHLYDDAFMGVSYLRSAQIGFASLAGNARQGPLPAASADAVLDDLKVAQDRAMSPEGRAAARKLADDVAAMTAANNPAAPAFADVQSRFEDAVETFAADGFRYRRTVGSLVADEVRRTSAVIAVTVLGALSIALLLSNRIAGPVRRAVRVAQSIAGGRLDNEIAVVGRGETAELLAALSVMQASIAQALGRIQALMHEQAASHAGELQAQHARLEAALDNMNQGLCLYGADGRLAINNRRFVEMFGAPRIGETAESVLREAGLELLLESEQGGAVAALSCELPDGRSIAVSRQAIASGGWVATYEDISERRATEARLAHMARHDALSGLPNRLLFSEHMHQVLSRTRRDAPAVLLCLNLDRFKAVNDTLGHAKGDRLLRAVADRLRTCAHGTDQVFRFGGDEFAIVRERATDPAEATAAARDVLAALAQPFDIDGESVVIGTSIGIAIAPDAAVSADEVLKSADLALDRAKAEGGGTFRFFETAMDVAMQARRALELDLRRALAEDQFELYYQPLMQEGGIAGFEALLRWNHPRRGLVSPATFIPIAEEIGLIGDVGAWVMQRACIDAAGWPGRLKVAVNLSPAQFRTRVLADDAAAALQRSGLPPSRLELEITESILMQDDSAALETLHALRRLGIRIAMDDFGTGYSSLSYLRRFPFDKIKIDQSFVMSMEDNEDCRTIVRAVIGLGRSLRIFVNAEGVETESQRLALRAEGCNELQGYLFSKPQPAHEIPELLSRLGNATLQAA